MNLKNIISLKGYMMAINSEGLHEVEIVEPHEFVNGDSIERINELDGANRELPEGANGTTVSENYGGGVNIEVEDKSKQLLGSFTLMTTQATKLLPVYKNLETQKLELHHSLSSETLAHELIGHGVARYELTKQLRSRPDRTATQSVRVTNMYLRIKKLPYYATAIGHNIYPSSPFNRKEYITQIPPFLKF